MISAHPCFKAPSDINAKIWRYISLPKFLTILQDNSLFFSRAHLLGDPFEGSLSEANINYRKAIKTFKDVVPHFSFFKNMNDDQIDQLFSLRSTHIKQSVSEMMVSCWHMSDYESAAMWKLYSSGEPIIAIQTTYKKLAEILPTWVHLGLVEYIDYKSDIIPESNGYYPIMHKRKSFEHEKEVRAVVWEVLSPELSDHYIKNNATPYGIKVPAKAENLIEEVYVDPSAPDWFKESVMKLCAAYSLEKLIHHSSLADKPLY